MSLPTPNKHMEQILDLNRQGEAQTEIIKQANRSLGKLSDEKDSAFTTYLAEVNGYLATLGLELHFEVIQIKERDKPNDPPPDYYFHISLDGHITDTMHFDSLHRPETKIAALVEFTNQCKTIHTMECVKSLESIPIGASTRSTKI